MSFAALDGFGSHAKVQAVQIVQAVQVVKLPGCNNKRC
jgi:hypothetical protein